MDLDGTLLMDLAVVDETCCDDVKVDVVVKAGRKERRHPVRGIQQMGSSIIVKRPTKVDLTIDEQKMMINLVFSYPQLSIMEVWLLTVRDRFCSLQPMGWMRMLMIMMMDVVEALATRETSTNSFVAVRYVWMPMASSTSIVRWSSE